MSSDISALKLLEEKLEDLQRDTKFCVNNYDYHHKNNEHEIIHDMQDLLKDSLRDSQQFIDYMKNVRSSIDMARQKCIEIDELLLRLGIQTETSNTEESCPSGSRSFHEEQKAAKYVDLEENKENTS